jgi:RHS repeat-associated protein
MYTGQRRETPTVYNYNARFYHTDIGRMPQADSIVPNAADPAAYNRYAYVNNNPANYTDPTGHFGISGPMGCMCMDLGTDPIVIVPDYQWLAERLREILGMPMPQHACTTDACFKRYSWWASETAWAIRTLQGWGADPAQVAALGGLHPTQKAMFGLVPRPTAQSGGSAGYVPMSCALYGSSSYGSCKAWAPTGGLNLVGGILKAIRSDCATGLVTLGVVAFSVYFAGVGVGGLVAAGGVTLATAEAAGVSAAALYYSAGPSNVNNIVSYGPSAISGVSSCVPK